MSEPRVLPPWLPSVGVALALAGLVALSFAERWAYLNESPYPVGVDGYFYAVQLRSLLETGELAYPAAPMAFWLMAPLAAATDPITGAKLGASIFGALVALPAYAVGARLGRCRGAGLVAAVIATQSAGSAYLTIEFVKNGIGLTVLLAALWLLLRAAEAPTRPRVALALVAGLAAVGTHKMAAVMLVLFAAPVILSAAAARGVLRGRRLLYVLGLVIGVTLLLAGLGIVFPRQLPAPGEIDLAGTFLADRPSIAAMRTPSFELSFGHEALIGGIAGAIAGFLLTRTGQRCLAALPASASAPRSALPGETAVAWVVVVLALVIAWPFLEIGDSQGLGVRLRIVAFVPLALAAAIIAGRVLARVKHRDALLAVLAVALATYRPGSRDEGRIVAHPAMVSAIQTLSGEVPATDTIVVPERHIVFMVAWYTRASVRLRPERVLPERRWRLMPLAWIGMGSPLDHALRAVRDDASHRPPLGLHPRHPNGLVLVHETTWQRVLGQLAPEVRAHWARWPTI